MTSKSSTIRGVDHVGLAVRDIEAATRFLEQAIGAEIIYETLELGSEPQSGAATEQRLYLASGAEIMAIRMLRVENGPGIELFQMKAADQHEPARASDLGWQHVALYTDNIESAVRRFVTAGGTALAAPHELPPLERGAGNQFCYVLAPFGALIEFVSMPSSPPYEAQTDLRRWRPGG